MVQNYDFVITSGGIGPTHDGTSTSSSPFFPISEWFYLLADITYASLARAFDQRLAHHPECLRRMDEMIRHRPWAATQNDEQREATRRMALFPSDAEVLFVAKDIWVVRLNSSFCCCMPFDRGLLCVYSR